MTAAIADHRPASTTRTSHRTARSERGRRPRLVPVPDSEPPLDDTWGASARAHARTDRPAPVRPNGPPEAAGPDPATALRRTSSNTGSRPTPAGPVRLVPPPRPPTRRGPPARRTGGPSTGLVPSPRPRPVRRRVPVRGTVVSADSVPGWSNEIDVGVRMTSTAALPSAQATGTAMARAVLEVLSGSRPTAQLRGHCAPDVFAGLQDTPMLGERGSTRLLVTQVCEPADGVAELTAVFRCAERVRAMALRMQGVDGRWRVTALHLG